mmetsp:Transcript_15137/g.41846  ORF Transcript_15137/g.41846 Transcript_15137/m.41846 type:complete len:213 (+) Transcript_15137:73-711(+)
MASSSVGVTRSFLGRCSTACRPGFLQNQQQRMRITMTNASRLHIAPCFSATAAATMTTRAQQQQQHVQHQRQQLSRYFSTTSSTNPMNDSSPPPLPPIDQQDVSQLTSEQLMETSDIPGWELVTAHPRRFPRGSLVGTVVSTKMQKTINVAVDRYRMHKRIRKRQRFTRKFMAHDEQEVANEGDTVLIVPCHKMSKHKHFLLSEILRTKGRL